MTFVAQHYRFLLLLAVFALSSCGYKDSLYVPEEAPTNQQSDSPQKPTGAPEKGK